MRGEGRTRHIRRVGSRQLDLARDDCELLHVNETSSDEIQGRRMMTSRQNLALRGRWSLSIGCAVLSDVVDVATDFECMHVIE